MSTAIEQPRTSWQGVEMSVEEFLALPDDGIHRELIRGTSARRTRAMLERTRAPVTVRNRFHSRIVIRIGQLLANWMDLQPEPRGEVVGGEAGFWLQRNERIAGRDRCRRRIRRTRRGDRSRGKALSRPSGARGRDPVADRHARRHRRDGQILSRGGHGRLGRRSRLRDGDRSRTRSGAGDVSPAAGAIRRALSPGLPGERRRDCSRDRDWPRRRRRRSVSSAPAAPSSAASASPFRCTNPAGGSPRRTARPPRGGPGPSRLP